MRAVVWIPKNKIYSAFVIAVVFAKLCPITEYSRQYIIGKNMATYTFTIKLSTQKPQQQSKKCTENLQKLQT